MMTLKLQIIIGIALIIALAVIITMIRKRQLELKYSLSWIIAIIFVLVLDCFPILLNKLSLFGDLYSRKYDILPRILFFDGDHIYAHGHCFEDEREDKKDGPAGRDPGRDDKKA